MPAFSSALPSSEQLTRRAVDATVGSWKELTNGVKNGTFKVGQHIALKGQWSLSPKDAPDFEPVGELIDHGFTCCGQHAIAWVFRDKVDERWLRVEKYLHEFCVGKEFGLAAGVCIACLGCAACVVFHKDIAEGTKKIVTQQYQRVQRMRYHPQNPDADPTIVHLE